MKITIIIPNYNRVNLIGFTLDSILNQTYQDWECIVVDDGSTDNSEEFIEKYVRQDSRFSLYKRPSSMIKGANSCRNFGLSKAKGLYIKWVDSDDLLVTNCLQLQIDLFNKNQNAQICLGYGQFFNDTTGILEESWSKHETSENYLYDHVINQIRWPIGAILWKRSILKATPFSYNLKNSQEWLMHSIALVSLKHEQIINLKEIIYLIRRGNLRMSSNTSSIYYLNQAKARGLLMIEILRKRVFNIKTIYQLIKQLMIYLFHSAKKAVIK